MPTNPITFDEDAARRIVAAVRVVEGMPEETKSQLSQRVLPPWFWAKTTGAYNDTTGYPFTAQLPDNSGGWDDDTFTGTRLFDASGCKHFVTGTVLKVSPQGYDSAHNPLFQCAAYTPGDLFEVVVSKTSGSAGSASAACSWVYTVTTTQASSPYTLATGASPAWGRAGKGKKTIATKGRGYYTSAGTFVLAQVDEEPDAGAC